MIETPGEVFVLQCCQCKQYFDIETREPIPEPTGHVEITHTYCEPCFDAVLDGLIADADAVAGKG